MVREGPDGGKGNKGRKSLKWVSPEKVWNALKAKTPEEEYIANCGAEIKDIEERVEENERALKELEKKLPSEEEKKEREMKAVEEFSIKKFSEFLSNEELEILKKWREYRELKKIVEENKYWYLIELIKASGKSDKFADLIVKDKYSDLIMKICEWIKDFSGEEKIVLATYLQNQNIILLGMDGNKYLWFYYTDFPEERAFENEVRSNLRKLWINGFVSYVWDSCYRPDWGELDRIREKVIFEYLSDSDKEDRLEFDKLKKEWEKLGTELESIKERKHAVEKYGLPEKEAISLYQWSENLEWVHDEVYDKENHALVVLHEYSDYNGSGWSEYWTVISIKRGKNTTKKSFMYRDRYDAEYKENYSQFYLLYGCADLALIDFLEVELIKYYKRCYNRSCDNKLPEVGPSLKGPNLGYIYIVIE